MCPRERIAFSAVGPDRERAQPVKPKHQVEVMGGKVWRDRMPAD
jgi:hypothetical protein